MKLAALLMLPLGLLAKEYTNKDYETKLKPFIDQYCLKCHGKEKQKVFDGLLEQLRIHPGGFIPAVRTNSTTRITLVSFERLQD